MDEAKKKKYLKIFRAEADDHLSAINQGLLDIEAGGRDPEVIHSVLRAAHTLKGSSRMLGLEEIGAVAHKMEDILKAIEEEQLPITSETVDRLLEGADVIAAQLDPEAPPEKKLVEPAVERLEKVLAGETSGEGEGKDKPAAPEKTAEKPPPKKPAQKPKKAKIEKAAPEETKPAKTEAPSPAPAVKDGGQDAPVKKSKSDTLRVEASKLDKLIDLTGELFINKIKFESKGFAAKSILELAGELISEFERASRDGKREAFKARLQDLKNQCQDFVQEFVEDVIELDVNVQEIQEGSLQLRMTPAATIFDEFPRLVRDIARDLGKEIHLTVQGAETELDKRLLEQIRGPLIHILRNACDHGIEPPEIRENAGKARAGSISLRAYHHGGSVVIEVSDDGAGMDSARIREVAVARKLMDARAAADLSDEEAFYLTLRPGFSTSSLITDLSGRGVGMDVVKTNVESLRGDLGIKSEKGKGTIIELRLPLTVSIIEALLIMQGGEMYAVPLAAVDEVLRMKVEDIVMDRGKEMVPVRGKLLPLTRLGDLLDLPPLPGYEVEYSSEEDALNVVVLKYRNQNLALEVDNPLRDQEILVKGLGAYLSRAPFISGATILRKGEPALILNVFDVFSESKGIRTAGIKKMVSESEGETRAPRILVIDDSITTRTIEMNILERAGYDVTTAVSAEDALDKLKGAPRDFDLFVVDVDMPGMNGFELTEKLKGRPETSAQPVIILTSRASDEDKRRGIAVGAQAYIVKGSFDQNVLLDTVKSLIGD